MVSRQPQPEPTSFRWGIPEWDSDFTTIPNPILQHHAELGVKENLFLLILHLASFKWERDGSRAFPSIGTLANRLGVERRAVFKLIARLRAMELLVVSSRTTANGRTLSSEYNVQPFSAACFQLHQQERAGRALVRTLFDENDVFDNVEPAGEGVPKDTPEGVPKDTPTYTKRQKTKRQNTPPTPPPPARPSSGGRERNRPSSSSRGRNRTPQRAEQCSDGHDPAIYQRLVKGPALDAGDGPPVRTTNRRKEKAP
jgi:hypothetical protein